MNNLVTVIVKPHGGAVRRQVSLRIERETPRLLSGYEIDERGDDIRIVCGCQARTTGHPTVQHYALHYLVFEKSSLEDVASLNLDR